MSLTWKDAVSTILVAAAGVVTYARLKAFEWPLLHSWRSGILALFIVGLGSCIVIGSGAVPVKNGWTALAAALGAVAFIVGIAGLITNSKLVFLVLAADILALWVVTTLHHIMQKGA